MKAALGALGVAIGALIATEAVMQPTAGDRVTFVLIFGGAALLAATAARWLGRRTARLRSIRTTVQVMSLATTALVVLVILAAANLMFLSPHDLRVVLIALLMAAGLGIVLSTSMADTLNEDLERLRTTVQEVGAGDLTARVSTSRPDELGDLARTFDAMTDRLSEATAARERAEAARKTLLASLSHDLRTPLTAMRVAVEALEDGLAPEPDRYLRSLSKDVDALSRLVDDLFLLSKIEADKLELAVEPVDVAELVDEAIEAMQPVADRSRVRLRLERSGETLVRGGPVELGRVVRNLLDNAIRFAPAGSLVDVSVGRDNGHVSVSVADDGPGFPPAFRSDAVREFSRADEARVRSHGGAGLGLAIVQGLVAAHGGSLRLGTGPGGLVTFALPADTPG
ncbi:MAG: HAMP domain-containing histidine kinase [Acidimicrobiia bacterium]|nr:HAMP domain-containing histidine kinase [Acidimicrobiia bacterium]NNL12436.1 HAMP domain-containing histidine kinase [Acidimicrobiia bacterium]